VEAGAEGMDSIMAITLVIMVATTMVMVKTSEAMAIHTDNITQIKVVLLIMYRRNSSTEAPASRRKSERLGTSPSLFYNEK
jgi:type II secretory pathway component PulJ